MKEFNGKVAVITGAASGIGRGLAEKCCKEGMKVVLADIDAETLSKTENELKKNGGTVISVVTDVSKAADVEELAQKTLDAFGAVHLLVNNAGVGVDNCLWDHTLKDWKWVMGVNLWGAIHGIRIFIPIMIKQDTECHVVNTSSIAGLNRGRGIYGVTKHGVVALSESLANDLSVKHHKIHVSVLCPGLVNTNIIEAERHRPLELLNDPAEVISHPERLSIKSPKPEVELGRSPQEVAEIVFLAIINKRFYVLTTRAGKMFIRTRTRHIREAFDDFETVKAEIGLTGK